MHLLRKAKSFILDLLDRYYSPQDLQVGSEEYLRVKRKNHIVGTYLLVFIFVAAIPYIFLDGPIKIFLLVETKLFILLSIYLLTKRNCENGTLTAFAFLQAIIPFLGYKTPDLYNFSICATFAIAIGICTLQGAIGLLITLSHMLFYNLYTRGAIVEHISSFTSPEEVAKFIDDQSHTTNGCIMILCVFSAVYFRNISLYQTDIEESMKTLKKVNQELTKTIERQDKLILSFSHELNNPLHTLVGNLEKIKLLSVDQSINNILLESKACLKSLQCLINNILDVSKTDQMSLDISIQTTSTQELFSSIWETCETLIRGKGLIPELIFPKKFPDMIKIDKLRMTQIIMNIISNAVKFTDKGEIKMKVSFHEHLATQSEIFLPEKQLSTVVGSLQEIVQDQDITIGISEHLVRIEIIDSGSGITKEQLSNIFDKPAHGKIIDGTRLKLGLSLWITRRILDLMGGDIRIYSEPNKGTSVIITMKCRVENPLRSIVRPMGLLLQKRRVLKAMIVEDIPFNAKINKEYLVRCGIQVLYWAKNGQEAVDFYRKHISEGKEIDLVLMDIEMPILDGKEATRRIRQFEKEFDSHHSEKNILPCDVIFLSGNCLDKEIRECLDKKGDLHGDDFMRKPTSFKDFKQVMNRAEMRISSRRK